MLNVTPLYGVREHNEKSPVWMEEEKGRIILCAQVKHAYGSCAIDLRDLVKWLEENRPELLERIAGLLTRSTRD